jgi:hypothetical protein
VDYVAQEDLRVIYDDRDITSTSGRVYHLSHWPVESVLGLSQFEGTKSLAQRLRLPMGN